MKRHAYLIIVEGEYMILEKTIQLLDSENADFFLHVDSKTADFDFDRFEKQLKFSKIYYTERTDVRYGTYSEINCELVLLAAAVKEGYDYYHLLSSADMPIRTKDEIEKYFEQHGDTEYLCFRENPDTEIRLWCHYAGFHLISFFQIGESNWNKPVKLLDRFVSLIIRRKCYYPWKSYRSGKAFFSITREFAEYVLAQNDITYRQYKYSFACTNVFLHTILNNSPYKARAYQGTEYGDFSASLRKIFINGDWGYANYITDENFDALMDPDNGCLFASRFSYAQCPSVVDRVFNKLMTGRRESV